MIQYLLQTLKLAMIILDQKNTELETLRTKVFMLECEKEALLIILKQNRDVIK